MTDEARLRETPFREAPVWKSSRFTRRREHAVALGPKPAWWAMEDSNLRPHGCKPCALAN